MYLVLGLDWFNQKVMIATNGIPIWYPIEDLFILMQYSGLHDRKHTSEYPKGQGIYVGDIIQFPFLLKQENGETQETIIKDVVAFERESGMFIVAGLDDPFALHNDECEIIGNIYENPELMSEAQKVRG